MYRYPKTTECSKCGKNLLVINPIFTIKGKPDLAYCSKNCRDGIEGTGPILPAPQPPAIATVSMPRSIPSRIAAPTTSAPSKGPVKPIPQSPSASPRPRASKKDMDNLVIHLNQDVIANGKVRPDGMRADSERRKLWNLIKEGQKVSELKVQVEKAGVQAFDSSFQKILFHQWIRLEEK